MEGNHYEVDHFLIIGSSILVFCEFRYRHCIKVIPAYLPLWPIVWIRVSHVRQRVKFNSSMPTNEIVAVSRRQIICSIMLDVLMFFEGALVCRHLEHNPLKTKELIGRNTPYYSVEGDAWGAARK